jgi:hypothetical protein
MAAKIDLNNAGKPGAFHPDMADNPNMVEEVKASLNASAEEVLHYLLPAGVRRGHEFLVGSLRGEKGESTSISLAPGKVGVGQDFATGQQMSDLIDVWCMVRYGERARYSSHFASCLDEIRNWLGMPQAWKKRPPAEPPRKREPLPAPSKTWTYTDTSGNPLVLVHRYDKEDGKKEYRPFTIAEHRWGAPEIGRPLYNLRGIAGDPSPFVVFAEGEKAADALIERGITATTMMSGAKAPLDKTDWSILRGKNVVVWPDADAPGRDLADRLLPYLKEVGCASVRLLAPPGGVPDGWDAADAAEDGLDLHKMVMDAAMEGKDRAGRYIRLNDWRITAFSPDPSPIRWAVDRMIPSGTAGLLVGTGDVGKGWLTLDLAIKAATPKAPSSSFGIQSSWLGHAVNCNGKVILLAAEDDKGEFERRIKALVSDEDRELLDGRLFVIPLPNAGGNMTLFKDSSVTKTEPTPDWALLSDMIAQAGEVALVIIDPLASFVQVDLDKDNTASAYVMGMFAEMASRTGAAILIAHHMRKGDIKTAEQAREAVRGSSAIVNGVRWVIAVWQAEEQKARDICKTLGRKYDKGLVAHASVVKSNAPADKGTVDLIRSTSSGLLLDVTQPVIEAKRSERDKLDDDVIRALSHAARAGHPFQKTGSHGVHENRHKLPAHLRGIGRDMLRDIVQRLLNEGRLVTVRFPGNVQDKWIDAKGGSMDKGIVQSIGQGSYTPPGE